MVAQKPNFGQMGNMVDFPRERYIAHVGCVGVNPMTNYPMQIWRNSLPRDSKCCCSV